MIIFWNNIKRILRKKTTLIFMLIVPTVLTAFTMYVGMYETKLQIGIVDLDNSRMTELLRERLENLCTVKVIQEEDIHSYLFDYGVDYIIQMDAGFTKALLEGKDPKIKGVEIQEANTSLPVKVYVDSFVNAAKNIALVSSSEEEFYRGIAYYEEGSFIGEYQMLENTDGIRSATVNSLGFLVMSMFYIASLSSKIVLKDKKDKVYERIFSSPITIKTYMLQNILSFLGIAILQIILIFWMITHFFNADLGPSILNIFVVFLVFALVTVSFGLCISSMSKNLQQAGTFRNLLTTPICMLGGCFWPREIMPDILQKAANFVPTTWVMKAAENVIFGETIGGVATELFILSLFAMIFFLLGSWRKVDISR